MLQTDIPEDSAEWSPQDLDGADTLPDDLPVDVNWDDLLPSASAPSTQGDEGNEGDVGAQNTAGESLR